MKIIIAPDSFKGSNSSLAAAEAIARGIRRIYPESEIRIVPVADGGEGTVEAVCLAAGGEIVKTTVRGPLGEDIDSFFGLLAGDRAVIEMAAASGLPLVPANRQNPLETTSYGTGQLIRAALDRGCREIMIGIGGSATTDCGIGLAAALGAKFLDKNGSEVPLCGKGMELIERIDLSKIDPRLSECKINAACDVTNPLYGPEGAAFVYSPQKGADNAMAERLDQGLRHLAGKVEKQLGIAVADVPGAGAAGGLGAGLLAFAGGTLKPGIEAVLDIVRFNEILAGADLVITGEGKLDGQSLYGKVPVGIGKRAKAAGLPAIAIVGDIGKNAAAVYEYGIDAVISTVNRAMPLGQAMAEGAALLEECGELVMRLVRIGKQLAGQSE
ncbi:MAG: glycerate kinase [Spirochaetales bacterium]|nr:glycerate kinase [Spirochaetales bacterium]